MRDRINHALADAAAIKIVSNSDRSELVKTAGNLIGVWDFTAPGIAFSTADMVFRYDDVLAASLGLTEADLRLYHRVGNAWVDITSGIDTTKNQLTATGVSSFSLFAVGTGVFYIPEPASLAVFGLAGLATLRRRNRRA